MSLWEGFNAAGRQFPGVVGHLDDPELIVVSGRALEEVRELPAPKLVPPRECFSRRGSLILFEKMRFLAIAPETRSSVACKDDRTGVSFEPEAVHFWGWALRPPLNSDRYEVAFLKTYVGGSRNLVDAYIDSRIEISSLSPGDLIPEDRDLLFPAPEAQWRGHLVALMALGFFLRTRVLAREKGSVSRKHRKKLRRSGRPDPPPFSVVKLRHAERAESTPSSAQGAPRACHWLVRGHIRKQFYPSTGEHREIWIEQHLAGDRSLPFRPKIYHAMR